MPSSSRSKAPATGFAPTPISSRSMSEPTRRSRRLRQGAAAGRPISGAQISRPADHRSQKVGIFTSARSGKIRSALTHAARGREAGLGAQLFRIVAMVGSCHAFQTLNSAGNFVATVVEAGRAASRTCA
jgi:hypothetical protein